MSRRGFVAGAAMAAAGIGAGTGAGAAPAGRRFHACLSEDALEADPALLSTVRQAGITDVWVTGYLYGYWHYTPERIAAWRSKVEAAGMAAHVCNVPLGHPGDSLGAMAGDVPLSPPKHWKPGVRTDGSLYSGTSLHAPATAENCAAVRQLAQLGVRRVMVDDDFRLGQSPDTIGGCYCPEHRDAFLKRHGYPASRWPELVDAVARRDPTPLLREWLEQQCDELTACFRAMQVAAGARVDLGIMVMYMGCEKAGIRLEDYRRASFRVGEGHFDDGSFGTVKGKTVELFSSLFHRRFCSPERALSETTAYPATALSAPNMAAKLAVSTISDVRTTMFMSGLSPFPRTHWETLGPAMRRNAAIHARIAGHRARGPFKHYWGMPSRYAGTANPFSLWLALGVPFEVCAEPPADGWTFLSDTDADARRAASAPPHGQQVARSGAPAVGLEVAAEDLAALFAWRRTILPAIGAAPHIVEETPAVCAWYPTAHAAIVWNLTDAACTLTVRTGDHNQTVALSALGVALIDLPPHV